MAENKNKLAQPIKAETVDVYVKNVSLDDLKTQRCWLFDKDCEEAEGLINLLDHMIDQAEGY